MGLTVADIIPAWVWKDAVIVERFRGRTATGTAYDPPLVTPCLVSKKARLVRTVDAREVTSSANAVFPPQVPDIPVESRVTMPDGHRATVVAFHDHRKPALPSPDHIQIFIE